MFTYRYFFAIANCGGPLDMKVILVNDYVPAVTLVLSTCVHSPAAS